MKKISVVFLTLALAFSLFACGSNIYDGRYNVSFISSEAAGFDYNYADLSQFELHESYIKIEGNTATFSFAGEGIIKYEIDLKENLLIDPTDSENNSTFSFSDENETLTISNPHEDGSEIVFVIEDSLRWEEIMAEESLLVEQIFDEATLYDIFGGDYENMVETPPDVKTESDDTSDNEDDGGFNTSTKSIELDSVWYGYMDIMNYEGPNDLNGSYDIYGYVGNDGTQDYFELYLEISEDSSPIATYYIDLYDDYFTPILDDYAFSFGELLTEDDFFGYSAYLDYGFIFLSEEHQNETESFDAVFGLREYGTIWDSQNEYLPPGYDDYLKGIGLSF